VFSFNLIGETYIISRKDVNLNYIEIELIRFFLINFPFLDLYSIIFFSILD
jgi:hypothetical protein